MNLSEKIQLCRKRAGLSQEALAEKLNVSRQAVSKWETGAAEPELSKLRALAAAFGVTADWLLSEEDAEKGATVGASAGGREGGAANSVSVRSDSASNTDGGPNAASGSGFARRDSGSSGEPNAAPGGGSARSDSASNTASGLNAVPGGGSARSDSASNTASGPSTAPGGGSAHVNSTSTADGGGFAHSNSASNTASGPSTAVGSGSARSDSASTAASGPSTAPGGGSAHSDSASTAASGPGTAPGGGSGANADDFGKSGAAGGDFADEPSAGKGSSGQGEGQAAAASGASGHREESSASSASANGQTASGGFHSASPAPNWVESVPGVLGRLLRQYGWIIGLRMAVSGALMTFIGFLGRAAVRSMEQDLGLGFEMVPSQTAWYDEAGNLMTSPVSMPSQPSDPMTILCTGMIVLGVILILAGICIAVSLRNQHRE